MSVCEGEEEDECVREGEEEAECVHEQEVVSEGDRKGENKNE